MNGTYLITPYKEKDLVKSLGARWDPARRQWYVPQGLDLTPFAAWLPADAPPTAGDTVVLPPTVAEVPASPGKGISLSQLLQGVEITVSGVFKEAIWTTVEVVDVRLGGGHVYLELSERDANGVITAKANATLWASRAERLLPEFERATGAQLEPGIKLLVRVRPVFKSQYGFSLDIDAIDPDYTLGDLEARKRDIRERLQREGLWQRNRQLPAPWDFHHVLVIAPEGGAGLQDFQAEAQRLQAYGVCQFTYVFSRFQGEGAAAQIRHELLAALENISVNHPWLPDAVAIIRGGGAVNDLAWLNDYELARAVCELEIPVLTGIGHERDNTLLDEVAHTRFDTPSKVIAGIERTLLQRVQETRALWTDIRQGATQQLEAVGRAVQRQFDGVQADARQQIARARHQSEQLESFIKLQAAHTLRLAADHIERDIADVQHLARQQLEQARRGVPVLMHSVETDARRTLHHAREHSQALMREITGQGPTKTLQRGFALVRDTDGRAITSAQNSPANITITFRDGQRAATLAPTTAP